MTARYALRSGPVVALACFAGALAGAQIGGGALMIGGGLLSGRPLLEEFDGNVGEFICSLLFWDMFQLPGPLFGLLIVTWPVLATIQAKRPDRLHPWLVYALCLGGMVIGGSLLQIPAFLVFGAPEMHPTDFLTVLLGSSVLSAALGLPAALVFRLIALKKASQHILLPFEGEGGDAVAG